MTRLFDQHRVRATLSLDGPWEYYFPAEGTRIDPAAWRSGVRETLHVPSVWEILDSRKSYRGQAVARRVIEVPQACRLRLVFKGISHTARVLLDGRELGGHHNAYTAFAVDAGRVRAGQHEILVHITNEYGELSALHIPNDYYNYGGISRPAELQMIRNDVLIRYVHAHTVRNGARWRVRCCAEIVNYDKTARRLTLQSSVAGSRVKRSIVLPAGSSLQDWELDCGGVDAWTPETPALYLLNTVLLEQGAPVDDLVERIGFRVVSVQGERILLNGKPIYPMGFNRHEDHALYGCAIPVDTMRSDLMQMRAMHANAVRTCHYPNDERFLDLCDELGFLVWEENHARGLNLEKMSHPRFREQCAACNEEMVRDHYNHPCIFVWGILNECSSETDEGAAMYQEQFNQLRALDASRPLTFASCRHARDLCQGMIDISGWNIYPQWYHNTPVLETLETLIARREPEGMKGKPLILSEFGAGGIPGYHDPVRRAKWSEERQSDILEAQLSVILAHPRVAGAFVWQFCDVRVDEAIAMSRPRCINDKGAVDDYRRPKLVFETIKRHFAAKEDALRTACTARAGRKTGEARGPRNP